MMCDCNCGCEPGSWHDDCDCRALICQCLGYEDDIEYEYGGEG